MQPSNGSHTLSITTGGTTTVTLTIDSTGFNAFGRRWTYDSGNDWYMDSGSSMWVRFSEPQPGTKVVAGSWGSDTYGGTWT